MFDIHLKHACCQFDGAKDKVNNEKNGKKNVENSGDFARGGGRVFFDMLEKRGDD